MGYATKKMEFSENVEEKITIPVGVYQDLLFARADYGSIYSIASHMDDSENAMQAIRLILGIWSEN